MSRTVSFRCSEELDRFLEQEAERRMTTKSTVAQLIVAQYARDVSHDQMNEHLDPVAPPETGKDESGGVNADINPDEFYSVLAAEFDSKDAADAVRSDFSEYVDSDRDDLRLKVVSFVEDTPVEVVEEMAERGGFVEFARPSFN